MGRKPWSGEFPVDRPEDMDDAAQKILLRTMRAGRSSSATKRHDYEVIVGNVGTVYRGGSKKKATKVYNDYVRISMGYAPQASRADGENVVLLCDNDICKEYIGASHRDEED